MEFWRCCLTGRIIVNNVSSFSLQATKGYKNNNKCENSYETSQNNSQHPVKLLCCHFFCFCFLLFVFLCCRLTIYFILFYIHFSLLMLFYTEHTINNYGVGNCFKLYKHIFFLHCSIKK